MGAGATVHRQAGALASRPYSSDQPEDGTFGVSLVGVIEPQDALDDVWRLAATLRATAGAKPGRSSSTTAEGSSASMAAAPRSAAASGSRSGRRSGWGLGRQRWLDDDTRRDLTLDAQVPLDFW
jgi:hypothetical protein